MAGLAAIASSDDTGADAGGKWDARCAVQSSASTSSRRFAEAESFRDGSRPMGCCELIVESGVDVVSFREALTELALRTSARGFPTPMRCGIGTPIRCSVPRRTARFVSRRFRAFGGWLTLFRLTGRTSPVP